MAEEKINLEVAYALNEHQAILPIKGEPGITLEEAVVKSGILNRFPDLDWEKADVGVFGKVAKRNAVLNDGDRVEIYRPLIADPKEMRKKRAAQGKAMRRGGGDAKDEEQKDQKAE